MSPSDAATPRHIRAISNRSAVVAAVAAFVCLAAAGLVGAGTLSMTQGAIAVMAAHLSASVAAALTTRDAARRSIGFSRRVWTLFGAGLTLWAAGTVIYIVFLVGGGDPSNPAVWTQVGFIAAYPCWYRALWLLRQPVIARGRRQRIETALVELTALALIGVVLGAVLAVSWLALGQNVVLILPAVLDLILVAGLYNAVRRSRLTRKNAHGWFALAFITLAASDIAVNFAVPRGYNTVSGIALAGYAVALGLFGTAARHPIHVTETQSGLGRSTAVVGVLALGLVGPAAALLSGHARWAVWAVGGMLLAWLWTRITVEGRGEVDALTGFLSADAFERHLAGVLALATSERPAALIVTDIDGFSEWTAARGFVAGNALISSVAGALETLPLPEGGAWARLTTDRFAWIGMIGDAQASRKAAQRIGDVATRPADGIAASTGVTLVPGDAETPLDALAAAEEAMRAARSSGRPVVAFDRGRLDGVPATSDYAQAFGVALKRARIEEVMASDVALEPAFQPIVALDGHIRGYEALARFKAEPMQGPDRWIQDAYDADMGLELEVECVRRALSYRSEVPRGAYVSVNVSPELVESDLLGQVLGDGRLDGIVFEITEHRDVSDYAVLADRLALLRGRGAAVAIDDAGAGFASMRHVLKLRPDYVKVDRDLVDGIHLDGAKRALMRSFAALAEETHALIVAEGVETMDELLVLQEIGVDAVQGYLLARPRHSFATLDDLPREVLEVITPGRVPAPVVAPTETSAV